MRERNNYSTKTINKQKKMSKIYFSHSNITHLNEN